jgi:3-isopropylmalate dehydrogenase
MLRRYVRPASHIAMSALLESPATTVDAPVPATTPDIAVLPGDGIGREVIPEAVRVLRALEQRLDGVRLRFQEYEAGAGEFARTGCALSDKVLRGCRSADAILLGAMGLPDVRQPDGRELTLRLFHPADSPLKRYGDRTGEAGAGNIDLVIIRESTEGLFSGRLAHRDPTASTVRDVMSISRRGSERVIRFAFRFAASRRRKLTLVDKANVLPSMAFFREVFDSVAAEFPEIETERVYVDAMALHLVRCPHRFDVIVTENMFGDILSDLAAGLVGGMGMAPSADLGDEFAVFQPSHGSAPDIAGQGIANPVATLLSAALMLDWLGGEDRRRGAAHIRRAVETVLADPAHRTPDMGGKLRTHELTDRIIAAL